MFPVQLTTSRIGNLTQLILLLIYVMTIHTYLVYNAQNVLKINSGKEVWNLVKYGMHR